MANDHGLPQRKPRVGVRANGRISTTTFLEPSVRDRLAYVSRKLHESIPETAAKLVEVGLCIAESAADNGHYPVAAGSDVDVSIYLLANAIIASRYPSDTGSTRLRQVALLAIVADQTSKNLQTTQTRLSQLIEAERGVIGQLGNTLVTRGIFATGFAAAAGSDGRKSGKNFYIREDALEAFVRHHRDTTGIDIRQSSIASNEWPWNKLTEQTKT